MSDELVSLTKVLSALDTPALGVHLRNVYDIDFNTHSLVGFSILLAQVSPKIDNSYHVSLLVD
jgi:hypothetical protein